MRGKDLAALLAARAPMDPAPCVAVFVQAARGLAAAHARGIVHRDVKPANLFLHTEDDGRLVVKVCDFGIAKPAPGQDTGSLTSTGAVLGSPHYMSPEQVDDPKAVDARTDVWSLCISLFEALSGRLPWEGEPSLSALLVAIATRPVPRLGEAAPWLDPGLAAVVQRGLARDRNARFDSAEALARALEPYARAGDVRLSDLTPLPAAFVASARAAGVPTRTAPDHGAHRSRRTSWSLGLVAALSLGCGLLAVWLTRPAPPSVTPATSSASEAPARSATLEAASASAAASTQPASIAASASGLPAAPPASTVRGRASAAPATSASTGRPTAVSSRPAGGVVPAETW